MVRYELRGVVDDVTLSALHESEVVIPWRRRLEEHSLTWVQAYDGDRLVGFVNVAWDGGVHAFLLDTVVDPGHACGFRPTAAGLLRLT